LGISALNFNKLYLILFQAILQERKTLTVDQFLNSSLIQAGRREALPSRLAHGGKKY